MIMVFDSLEAGNDAANWDKAAAHFIGRDDRRDSSHATYGRARSARGLRPVRQRRGRHQQGDHHPPQDARRRELP